MRRQVWDVTEGEHAGASVVMGPDGEPRLVRRLARSEVLALLDTGGLTPRHADASQYPAQDLLRPPGQHPLRAGHLRAS